MRGEVASKCNEFSVFMGLRENTDDKHHCQLTSLNKVNCGQRRATKKRISSYACYTIWDSN